MVKKMKIYTITLNPAYDVHASAEDLSIGHENLACVISRDIGGKGINISRALAENQVDNTAIVVLGSDNADDFKQSVTDYGINCIFIEKNGRIRENLTIHTECGETRISFSGFSLDENVLGEIESLIEIDGDTIITFTGSVPRGISIEQCKEFLMRLKANGVRVVIDSKSFTLDDLIAVKPWLIKPNGEEIEAYSGREIKSFSDCKDIAAELCRNGIENVMISLGEQGAMLVNSEGSFVAVPPVVDAVSTVGAGDSTIAGFISAFSNGKNVDECLKVAVSFGSAACLREGTVPPRICDVEEILRAVKIFLL